MTTRLEWSLFKTIVHNTPLISIDLVIKNKHGLALLGQRQNKPAQYYWFVPGGRILKNETLADAFKRITREELGLELGMDTGRFLGVYEHFYKDSFFGQDISTHYVVHGYELILEHEDLLLPYDQHDSYQWFDESAISSNNKVHQYTKNYFILR
ncbi:GDP-mannose mannosyl hydrolase [Buttiauxella agrestis]|uniref:GDP-mannose mannosyl hydrolase n=1 Tax=Buttiauxella agrestis TaxID=82977 RepID=UPI001561348B|nr:GDP-mannose mannosyl hydrolase [Buttiauxella agrestis]BCG08842.1 GDP-mannose mannosyl hydrolase [Buttiauxella agrestis]